MTVDKFLKEAELGVPEMQYVVALCYENGWSVQQDMSIAEAWLIKSAEQGYAPSQYGLSLMLQASSNDSIHEGIHWLHKSAEQGYAPACFLYSLYREDGTGVNADVEDAFRFCICAAEKDYRPAVRKVASMLEDGIGVAKNLEHAFYWRLKAAEMGDADSAASVGRMYAYGIGVAQSDQLAMEWLMEGKKRESPWAFYTLSTIYRLGELAQEVDCKLADELGKRGEELLRARANQTQ